jgi:hypothetical protein
MGTLNPDVHGVDVQTSEPIAPKMSATLKENAGHVIKYSGT